MNYLISDTAHKVIGDIYDTVMTLDIPSHVKQALLMSLRGLEQHADRNAIHTHGLTTEQLRNLIAQIPA